MNHTLLIALALVGSTAAIVMTLIYFSRRQTQAQKKALWLSYHSLLSEYNIKTDLVDEFAHRILGLDSTQKIFVAVQQDLTLPSVVIGLGDVVRYGVIKSGTTTITSSKSGKNDAEEHVHVVALLFALRDGSKVEFPIYSEILDGIGERSRLQAAAENWRTRLEAAGREQEPALPGSV